MFTKIEESPYPIYFYSDSKSEYYYTPGYLLKVRSGTLKHSIRAFVTSGSSRTTNEYVQQLHRFADLARRKYQYLFDTTFEPQCLTLYLNQKCTLNCIYCFSNIDHTRDNSRLSLSAIHAAIRLVAENCQKHNQPLTVVFHGGGEPILSWKTIEKIQPFLSEQCKQNNIPLFRYISTNGVMSEERAHWLAKSVDMVGISCDGPASVQSIQRPLRDNNHRTSTHYLERTARILKSRIIPLQVRVTLTRDTFNKQAEICDYICKTIQPETIHVEPVYSGGKSSQNSLVNTSEIDEFVDSYFEAQSLASHYGVRWEMSEFRLNEIHTAYCNIFRQVLQLVPGNTASACFKYVNSQQIENTLFDIGQFNPKSGIFLLDRAKISSLQAKYFLPKKCNDCFIKYQCTHNCPNNCCLSHEETSNFLCQLNQQIAFHSLQKIMKKLEETAQSIIGLEI